MGGFGEKLDDNRVSKWAEKYINYEKGKTLIQKARTAADARDEFAARKPDIAAAVRTEHEAALAPAAAAALPPPPPETYADADTDTTSLLDTVTENAEDGDGAMSSERAPLVASAAAANAGRYGGEETTTTTTVGKDEKSFAAKYTDKLKQAEKQHDILMKFLAAEREKVVNFYIEKTAALEEQFESLTETVHDTYEIHEVEPTPPPPMRALFTSRRRSASVRLVKRPVATQRMQSVMAIRHDVEKAHLEQKIGGYESDEDGDGDGDANLEKVVREVDSLKRSLIELHRTGLLLNNFSLLNFTAFAKLVKRYNKYFPKTQLKWDEVFVNADHYEGRRSQRLCDRMVDLFAQWFCDGNTREAEAQMVMKKGDSLQMDWTQLRVGYRLGVCLTLSLWICVDALSIYMLMNERTPGGRSAFPVFRGCGGLLLVHWCWAISVYVWRRYRVNYIFLFEFNPKLINDPIIIFLACVDETIVFLVLMLLYSKAASHTLPIGGHPGLYPFLLVIYTVLKLIFPLKTRKPLWRAIWVVVTSPLSSPDFFHIYVADCFTSMVKVFLDLLFTCCFIFSGDFLIDDYEESTGQPHSWQHSFWYKHVTVPLICFFPLWIRLMQCLRRYIDTGKRIPNLANAAKYALSQTVTLFGAFHPLYTLHGDKESHHSMNIFQFFWVAVIISSTLYSYIWDVYMDWGLGRPKYAMLGPRLMFPNKWHYYGVMSADLVLRFMWVQSLIPPSSGGWVELPSYLTAVNMAVELLRRTLWGFFRLENEHRSNTAGYRKEDFVPLHFTTEHRHQYKHEEKQKGWRVLLEVISISAVVVIVSFFSIVASQTAESSDVDGNRDL